MMFNEDLARELGATASLMFQYALLWGPRAINVDAIETRINLSTWLADSNFDWLKKKKLIVPVRDGISTQFWVSPNLHMYCKFNGIDLKLLLRDSFALERDWEEKYDQWSAKYPEWRLGTAQQLINEIYEETKEESGTSSEATN